MEDIDYTSLIKVIQTSTKKNYQARLNPNNKPTPNVCNLGAKAGQIAKIEREGEYHGLAIEFLEDLQPLLTDQFVIRLLLMLSKQEYITVLSILYLTTIDELAYALSKWLGSALSVEIKSPFKSKKSYPSLDKWINTVRHDPILGKIRITDIGFNEKNNTSVVPPDWLGRDFESAVDLHSHMDGLETRIGKPPVTYCCIYSMWIVTAETIITDPNEINNLKFARCYLLTKEGLNLKITSCTKVKIGFTYVKYDGIEDGIIIGFVYDDLLENKIKPNSKIDREVGILVSRLQKSIRRGRMASDVLVKTIKQINDSPNYNLPDHGFLRVSASKQLVWRLYISIMEDVRPFEPKNGLSLLHLILLVLICQRSLESKFTPFVLNLIQKLALEAQFNDTESDLFPWRTYEETTETKYGVDPYHDSIKLALDFLPMMPGDGKMLRKLYSVPIEEFKPFNVPPKLYSDPKIDDDVILSSIDQHNKTYIILYYQACVSIESTTKEISNYIWNVSSGLNCRNLAHRRIKPDPLLRKIQKYLSKKNVVDNDTIPKIKSNSSYIFKNTSIPNQIKRTSFLILFGQKYRHASKDIVIAGTNELPVRTKINNEWSYNSDVKTLNAYPKKSIDLKEFDPPIGYKWMMNKVSTEIIDGVPYLNSKPIEFFDGSSVLQSIEPIISNKVSTTVLNLIIRIFSGSDIDFDEILNLRNSTIGNEILNWVPSSSKRKYFDETLIKLAYTKIFNQFDNIISIGPVDRGGNRMHSSINYLYEGKLWLVFNLFHYLYPETLRTNGVLNFVLNKNTAGYVHLIRSLEEMLFQSIVTNTTSAIIPKIKTKLWDHQTESVKKIVAGFKKGFHGFGDASDVGAGKTLTSLTIASNLIDVYQSQATFSGVLVLLPGNKLIDTWKDELKKHTTGFDIVFQENDTDTDNVPIKPNTIIITTIGRIRDHPIDHKWLLVVIDECLTVQNKTALQTEEAWKQSLVSKHLIMMSATFFRTRFDKLYYMLKMLQTGLPERKEYLDTILLESIVCQVSSVKRKWNSTIHKFELDSKSRIAYNVVHQSDLSLEKKYSKLMSFVVNNESVVSSVSNDLKKLVTKLEKEGRRCLIYARSMEEAKLWSDQLKIGIYPVKKKHTIVTYNDGTYGLNDLIIYDTIVMRPPAPDKLPQIKGRLDRPGQALDELHIEYFILRDTIEEGLILRMEVASQFIHKYIMPLAQFYDISINFNKFKN